MPSPSFPLLRLPLVALREIFEKIALRELFSLSLCSKRMHYAVKHFRDKSVKPTLKIHGIDICFNSKTGHINFTVDAMCDNILEGLKMERIEGRAVCIIQYRDKFLTCWENEVDGTKALVEYITALFEVKVELLSVSRASFLMMDYVEELQGPGSYSVEIIDVTDEQLKHVLVDLNPKSLTINQTASNENFQIKKFRKTYDEFSIFKGGWITVENLCSLDCIELQIVDKRLSSTEINQFFNHVMAGGSPRLKVFECRVRSADSNAILAGIRECLTAVPGKEQFTSDRHGNWEFNGRLNREEDSALVHINYFSWFKGIRLSVRKM